MSGAARASRNVSVMVADANPLFSHALALALAGEPGMGFVDTRPASAAEAVAALIELVPDVALVDYWMPGPDPEAMMTQVCTASPATKVLVTSWLHGPREIQTALSAGAAGFLPKSLMVVEVAEAIERAAEGEVPVFEGEMREMVERISRDMESVAPAWEKLSSLTLRELQVLRLLSLGNDVTVIARKLKARPATVRKHLHNLLTKTGSRSQLEAVTMAWRHGLIQP